ncbi:MAG: hypothetical protein F6K00_19660 [Leptolyngbya sp. SIOISBB]|nr:hypothetical protein [Leptolyngbya sp. SIOISBB]
MGMLQGLANFYAVDSETQLPLEPVGVTFDEETSEKLSQRFNSQGVLVTSSQVQGTSTESGTIDFNSTTWGQLAFARGQKPRQVTGGNLILPDEFVYDRVPTSAPYEINDPYVTAVNDALRGSETIKVSANETAAGMPAGTTFARASTPASPAEGEVGVDTSGGKLVFDAAQAGLSIFYPRYKTFTDYQDIGGPTGFTNWGTFALFGEIVDPGNGGARYIFRAGAVTLSGKAPFTVDDSVPTLSVPVAFGAPAGEDTGIHLINKFGAVTA